MFDLTNQQFNIRVFIIAHNNTENGTAHQTAQYTHNKLTPLPLGHCYLQLQRHICCECYLKFRTVLLKERFTM